MGTLNTLFCFNKTAVQKRSANGKIIFKYLFPKGINAGTFFYLLISGTITLKTALKYFKLYLSKVRKYIYPFNEKPSWRLIDRDRVFTIYFNLNHWYFTNESHSMAQVLYAQEPRDPE